MPKETITRAAADNEYLHRDFHGALSAGLDYVEQRFGEDAVREYLRQFARQFYRPLREDLLARGLTALRDHFEAMYRAEGGDVHITCSPDELVVEVTSCPAVAHMRAHGYHVSPLFHETTRTVNDALCEGTNFVAELVGYDPETGRGVQRFSRRTA